MTLKKKVKPICWISDCDEDVRAMSEEVRDVIGYALYQAQIGEQNPAASRMKGKSSAL